MNPLPPFSPVSGVWQEETCDMLGLDVFAENAYTTKETPLRKSRPNSFISIKPDGNCLLSAIAEVVTGRQDNHPLFRAMVCQHTEVLYFMVL